MKSNLICLIVFILILMSTAGCSVVRIIETGVGYGVNDISMTPDKKRTFDKRDFNLTLEPESNGLAITLKYTPYTLQMERSVTKIIPRRTLIDWGVGLTSAALLAKVLSNHYDSSNNSFDSFDWNTLSGFEKAILIGVPVDLMLYPLVGKATRRGEWVSSGGEIPGQPAPYAENHSYQLRLPDYDFSKKHKLRNGFSTVLFTEFLEDFPNPSNFHQDLKSIEIEALTEIDGNKYTGTIRLSNYDEAFLSFLDTLGIDTANRDREKGNTTSVSSSPPGSQSPSVRSNPEYKREGKDYAVLFGINEYDNYANLNNPIYDIDAISDDLKDIYGFETEVCPDYKVSEILEKLGEYGQQEFGPEDQLLIFIAAHGVFNEEKEGFIVGKDSDDYKNDTAYLTFLPHSRLSDRVNKIPCKHILLVLDSCYSGTFDEQIAMRNVVNKPLTEADIKRKFGYTTRKYLTSGAKEEVSDGKIGHHSPFTRAILDALRSEGGDGILELHELQKYIKDGELESEPRSGRFGRDAPGSDFLFIVR